MSEQGGEGVRDEYSPLTDEYGVPVESLRSCRSTCAALMGKLEATKDTCAKLQDLNHTLAQKVAALESEREALCEANKRLAKRVKDLDQLIGMSVSMLEGVQRG